MISFSKLTLAATLAAVVFSAPAFAQSIDHTGTLQPSHYDSNGKQLIGPWAPGSTEHTRPLGIQGRALYNYAPTSFGGSAATPSSGYDPSIATQR